jgi:hypothetical protein
MSDVGEKWRFLIANSDMSPEGAMQFIKECIALGVEAAAFRDDVEKKRNEIKAKRAEAERAVIIANHGKLRIVADDQGHKDEEGGE